RDRPRVRSRRPRTGRRARGDPGRHCHQRRRGRVVIELSLGEIAEATGGQVHPATAADLRITGTVVTDSREADPGGLYVARLGEHADGHDYVAAAADKGAVAALTQRVVPELPCVVVPDTTDGFAALGREVVDRCTAAGGLQIVAIT